MRSLTDFGVTPTSSSIEARCHLDRRGGPHSAASHSIPLKPVAQIAAKTTRKAFSSGGIKIALTISVSYMMPVESYLIRKYLGQPIAYRTSCESGLPHQ